MDCISVLIMIWTAGIMVVSILMPLLIRQSDDIDNQLDNQPKDSIPDKLILTTPIYKYVSNDIINVSERASNHMVNKDKLYKLYSNVLKSKSNLKITLVSLTLYIIFRIICYYYSTYCCKPTKCITVIIEGMNVLAISFFIVGILSISLVIVHDFLEALELCGSLEKLKHPTKNK